MFKLYNIFSSLYYILEIDTLELKSKDTLHDAAKTELKKFGEIRVEPPVPVEPIIKSNVETKQEKAIKVDNGNTISKDAINKEEEELERRPEIDILNKLKSHENEEKKILAESKKILEELKGARQIQFEKNKTNPNKPFSKDLNSSIDKNKDKKPIMFSGEKKNQVGGVEVKDKLPLPLVLKEANNPSRVKTELNRDKRDITSTMDSNNDNKDENCEKADKDKNEELLKIKNDSKHDKDVDNLDIKN